MTQVPKMSAASARYFVTDSPSLSGEPLLDSRVVTEVSVANSRNSNSVTKVLPVFDEIISYKPEKLPEENHEHH